MYNNQHFQTILFRNISTPRFVGVDENGHNLKDELKNKITDIKELLCYEDEVEIRDSLLKTKNHIHEIIDIIKILDNEVL